MTDPFPDRRPGSEWLNDPRPGHRTPRDPDHKDAGWGFWRVFFVLLGVCFILFGLIVGLWLVSAGHPLPVTIGAVLGIVFVIAGSALIVAGRPDKFRLASGARRKPGYRLAAEGGLGFMLIILGIILVMCGIYLGSCSARLGAPLLLGFCVVFVIAGVAVMRAGFRQSRLDGEPGDISE